MIRGTSFDPICGLEINRRDSYVAEYKERVYYFCSEYCRDQFEQQSEMIRVWELLQAGALITGVLFAEA